MIPRIPSFKNINTKKYCFKNIVCLQLLFCPFKLGAKQQQKKLEAFKHQSGPHFVHIQNITLIPAKLFRLRIRSLKIATVPTEHVMSATINTLHPEQFKQEQSQKKWFWHKQKRIWSEPWSLSEARISSASSCGSRGSRRAAAGRLRALLGAAAGRFLDTVGMFVYAFGPEPFLQTAAAWQKNQHCPSLKSPLTSDMSSFQNKQMKFSK